MQLIDTDIDVGAQTKMSTMQQESFEKFRLIENACCDITDKNDECENTQEEQFEKNVEANDETAQHTESRQEPSMDDKRNEKYDKLSKICYTENKENGESDDGCNIKIEDGDKVKKKENDVITPISDTHNEEKLGEGNSSVDTYKSNKNQSKLINKPEEENKVNCDMEQDKSNNTVIYNNKKTEAQNKVNNSITEDEMNDNSEIVDRIGKNNKEHIERDVIFEEEDKMNNSSSEDIVEGEMKQNSEIEDKIGKYKENIEVDITYKKYEAKDSITKKKNKDLVENSSKIDEKVEKQNEEDIEMDIAFVEGDKVYSSKTEEKTEGEMKEKQNKEDIEMEDIFEDCKVHSSLTEYIIEGKVKEDGHLFQKQNEVKNSVTEDTIKEVEDKLEELHEESVKAKDNIEEVKNNSEIDYQLKKQAETNIEMDNLSEKQDQVKNIVTENIINKEVKNKLKELQNKESFKAVDNIREKVKNNSKLDSKIKTKSDTDMELDDSFEKQDEVLEEVINKLEEIHNEESNKAEDNVVEEVKENNDLDVNIKRQNEGDIEMDDSLLKLDEVRNIVTEDTVREKVEDNLEEQDINEIEIPDNLNNSETGKQGTSEIEYNNEYKNKDIKLDGTLGNQEGRFSSVKEDQIAENVRDNNEIKDNCKLSNIIHIEKKETGDVLEEPKDNQTQNNVNKSAITDTTEEQNKKSFETDNNEKHASKQIKMNASIEEQDKVNKRVKEVLPRDDKKSEKLQPAKSLKVDILEELKEIDMPTSHDTQLDQQDKNAELVKKNTQINAKFKPLSKAESEIEHKFEKHHIEMVAMNDKYEKSPEKDKDIKIETKPDQNFNKIEDNIKEEPSEKGDTIAHAESFDACKINNQQDVRDHSKKDTDKNLKDAPNDSSYVIAKDSDQSDKLSEPENHIHNCKKTPIEKNKGVEKKNVDLDLQVSDVGKHSTFTRDSETTVSQMDTDEVIDIADDMDQDISGIQKKPVNVENIDSVGQKSKSALKYTSSVGLVLNDATESSVQNVQQISHEMTGTESVVAKKKLTHISKLSNTLDILSDEEEDDALQKEPQKVLFNDEKQCTSINLDDDDDIMLIDEEPKTKDDDTNITESLLEPESDVLSKEESKGELKDKSPKKFENNKDTKQTEVTIPCVDKIKTHEPKQEVTAKEVTTIQKEPLVNVNFLNTCQKNLADMTRDELEEFCILKIVESVVDRSNLSEIKNQLKTMAQSFDEYKKKAALLAKQNRDIQVVVKTIQEEQKKKSNLAITPLKITRSVGMQVLMHDKPGGRKKNGLNGGLVNTALNSGINRQAKAAQNQTRLQKILTNTNNPVPIPVPRLVPATNNSNSNVKTQSPVANTTGKSQITSPVINSPIQSVSNGLPATPPAQKPEKRPHSRTQQGNSFVDLTDDEPPAKVVARNVTPPVRLVPPQNLLAPNRQPFGANNTNPRKVYIPISGSQTPVGVRPGQTIMLKSISPQGPRQRVPTPSVVKSNQSSNTVRMQRVPSRHPAPLPDSVKQYQPLNWKSLPPAPELKLSKVDNGIVISWKIDGYLEENYEEIASYQLYAYQETSSPPSTTLWKKIGDVKALPLPMACTLTQFMAGFKYYFAVRAVDVRSRLGPFSLPGSILLLNKL